MSLICPISNGMFLSQSAPKVLLDPKKDFIFIMELYKLYKIGRKLTKSSLQSKTQTLHLWNDDSKLTLKNYIGVLQHGLPYSVGISRKNSKNSLKFLEGFRFCDLRQSKKTLT